MVSATQLNERGEAVGLLDHVADKSATPEEALLAPEREVINRARVAEFCDPSTH